jgi:hypothetical protein
VNTREAEEFINSQVVFEPGLTVRAGGEWLSFADWDALNLTITLMTTDSGSVSYLGRYAQGEPLIPVTLRATLLPYEYATREQLLHRVIRMITELRQHDTREFTRYRDESGRWVAPFFPHSEDGNALWARGGRPAAESSKKESA